MPYLIRFTCVVGLVAASIGCRQNGGYTPPPPLANTLGDHLVWYPLEAGVLPGDVWHVCQSSGKTLLARRPSAIPLSDEAIAAFDISEREIIAFRATAIAQAVTIGPLSTPEVKGELKRLNGRVVDLDLGELRMQRLQVSDFARPAITDGLDDAYRTHYAQTRQEPADTADCKAELLASVITSKGLVYYVEVVDVTDAEASLSFALGSLQPRFEIARVAGSERRLEVRPAADARVTIAIKPVPASAVPVLPPFTSDPAPIATPDPAPIATPDPAPIATPDPAPVPTPDPAPVPPQPKRFRVTFNHLDVYLDGSLGRDTWSTWCSINGTEYRIWDRKRDISDNGHVRERGPCGDGNASRYPLSNSYEVVVAHNQELSVCFRGRAHDENDEVPQTCKVFGPSQSWGIGDHRMGGCNGGQTEYFVYFSIVELP